MTQVLGLREFVGTAFDADFYEAEYPDLGIPKSQMLDHFCEVGWIEGRNPNPYFDTTSYLITHRDVAISGMNPLFHYLQHGRYERRKIVPSVRPAARSNLLFGFPVVDWVTPLRGVVDADYYKTALPELVSNKIDLVAHFAFRGWREGLLPNEHSSIAEIQSAVPKAVALLVNPFLALLEVEKGTYQPENEKDSLETSGANLNNFQSAKVAETSFANDEISLLAEEFDPDFYLRTQSDVALAKLDPLEHFFYTGWREGRNPRADFDTNFYLFSNPEVREAGINPFLHYIKIGRAEGRLTQGAKTVESLGSQDAEQILLVSSEFSVQYYMSQYTDIVESGVSAVEHYFYTGWKERRNPNKNFDSTYYLEANEDVRSAGLNPFWHYLIAGRAEGRAPVRPGGYRRRILDAAKDPIARSQNYAPSSGKPLSMKLLRQHLSAILSGKSGLVIALSHDCYVQVIGGTQIFIADEERRFRAKKFAYLQMSPRKPQLATLDDVSVFEVQLVLDGKILGFCELDNATKVIGSLCLKADCKRIFVIHSLLGFDLDRINSLRDNFKPDRSFFWLHDYTSLCEGFNLLRNDLSFCNSPPVNSIACRVCVYGSRRGAHLNRLQRFFENGNMEVVAPSEFTLKLWQDKNYLKHAKAFVHPHWTLTLEAGPPKRKFTLPVKVAFVGYPSPSKGWETFAAIVDEFGNDPRYKFYHFGAKGVSTLPECEFVTTEVTPRDRMATQRLLKEYEIDFIAMLSPWPETFSYVAHEGVAAGCHILCLKTSGNVAALAERLSCGKVFGDTKSIVSFFQTKAAVISAKNIRKNRKYYVIEDCGTSATLIESFAEEVL
ncbi:hypothetical protein JMJ56_31985 [Belnapia sp. T18]|uniref:Glycosyl transferase family 1 domain-containing protein n=1 Tax=Belnapia arida TaxID=2804533 RepID=A0ABS1UD26_9PROT|nr:hypothetical protein [Belnapia arida]MBL6082587.1 hypothetical protein [Belnapia arida]